MASSNVGKLSREEFRRQKDLDAARKAGTAPAEVDELGRPINPHIPQYISKAPWYLDTGAPSLAHQRRPEYDDSASKLNEWYDRGAKAGPAATKYRKGACENCGAMTHKKKDCLERPRKKGAKFTNQDIAADEVIQDIQAGYDAKRDRWNGYDPAEHSKIYEEYAAVEAARTKLREEQIDSQTDAAVRKVAKASGGGNDEFGSSDEEDEDEDKYADAADAVGQKLDAKTRITVRNLRIREDTAKYLINLDPTSAYYDPKTRSMRDNPNKNVRPEDAQFAGDNFLRNSGDSVDVQRLQLFAWQSEARGNDVHLHANPTQGEILHQQYKEKKEQLKSTSKVGILAKYGGEEYLEKAPKELLNGQTEDYVEYSRTGQVIKGRERAKARSKYDEDVFTNNHTAVWGSWYQVSTGKWGFACCHSTLHGSYCAGQAGIEAAESASAQKLLNPPKSLLESHAESSGKGKEKAQSNEDPSLSKKRLGDVDVSLDKEKLQRALAEERKRKKGELDDDGSDKKRKYNSAAGGNMDVTEEELEAYRMQRSNYEDPMANYKDTAYNRIDDAGHEPEFPTQPDCCFVSTRADHSTPRAALMSSMFRKKAASKKSVDAFSDSEQSESDVSNAPTTAGRADPTKSAPGPGSSPSTKSMSSEAWTVIIGLLLGIVGRLLYAQFGGIEHYVGSLDAKDDSLWASVLRDLNAQEGTIGAVVIGLWEGVLLHQIMRISARAAAGVFAGLAGRLLIDLVSPEPGQAIRFTASLLGISLGMLFSEVIRGVFDEKDHWEDRKVTHYHKSSRRLRKSSGRRRRTTSTAELDDPDLTDDPRSVAATSIAGTAFTAGTSFTTRSEREKRSARHRRALSERDSQHAESVIRGASPLPHVLTGDLEAEIADLRRQASAAAGQQRKYQEASARREQKYEYAQGNGTRALQLAWEVKRYEALAESLTRQVGDKIVEAHRRAVEKELATPLPAGRSVTPAQRSTGAANRPGGYHSETDSRRKQAPVRVTVSAGGETYEVTADDEEVEIGPNLRVRTRHVYQPPISQPPEPAPDPVLVTPTRSAHTRQSSVTPTPSPARPPRSVPRSKLSNFAQSVGGDDDDMRSVSVGSRAKTRSRRDSD